MDNNHDQTPNPHNAPSPQTTPGNESVQTPGGVEAPPTKGAPSDQSDAHITAKRDKRTSIVLLVLSIPMAFYMLLSILILLVAIQDPNSSALGPGSEIGIILPIMSSIFFIAMTISFFDIWTRNKHTKSATRTILKTAFFLGGLSIIAFMLVIVFFVTQ